MRSRLHNHRHTITSSAGPPDTSTLGFIVSAEIIALWFGMRYLLSTAEYQPSSNFSRLTPVDSPIPTPSDETAKYEPQNIVNKELQAAIFRPGTPAKTILRNLGEPVWRKPGFWKNSIAWSYENVVLQGIDIGYIFDRRFWFD